MVACLCHVAIAVDVVVVVLVLSLRFDGMYGIMNSRLTLLPSHCYFVRTMCIGIVAFENSIHHVKIT